MEVDEGKLIFCTGAPGSMWSRIVFELSRCSNVDNSDQSESRTNDKGQHFGNYFGPGMEFGEYFLDLESSGRTSKEILLELGKPYEKPYGHTYRLLKSHTFSHNLFQIQKLFPNSRVLMIWRDNIECFDWWMEVGGFKINYPDYTAYVNEKIMKDRIKQENEAILNYAKANNVSLSPMTIKKMTQTLGLQFENESVFDQPFTKEFKHVLIGIV